MRHVPERKIPQSAEKKHAKLHRFKPDDMIGLWLESNAVDVFTLLVFCTCILEMYWLHNTLFSV